MEACIPTIKKHNSRSVTIGNYEGKASQSRNNNEDRNAPIAANQGAANSDTVNIRPHRLMKTSRQQSKRRDQHLKVTPS